MVRIQLAHPGALPRMSIALGAGGGVFLPAAAAVVAARSWWIIQLQDRAWLVPLILQALAWDWRPRVADGLSLPDGLGYALILTATLFFAGYLAASLLIPAGTPHRRLLVAPASLLLGYALAGFIGLLAAALGVITRAFCLSALAVALLLLIAASMLWRDASPPEREVLPPPASLGGPARIHPKRWATSTLRGLAHWQTAAWAVVALVVLLSLFHALLFPVTEWDAVIYHAGTAKLWYLNAPNPPLLYGPSVGIQISINYPPLFPGIGTFYYTALEVLDDRYLKIVCPLLYISLIATGYYGGRLLKDKDTGVLAALLIAVTPLCFMYAVWVTSYMLSTLLVLLLLITLALHLSTQYLRYLIFAGLLLGLIAATTYLVMYVAAFLALVLVVTSGRRLKLSNLPYFLIPAVCFGLPWYVRNAALLHDPIYPLGSVILPSLGIDRDLFQATQDEIRNNALGYWSPRASKLQLLVDQIWTLSLDKNLAPFGSLLLFPAMILAVRRRNLLGLVLSGWTLLLYLSQLAIGWFWLRTLLLALPGAEIVMAWVVMLCIRRAAGMLREAWGSAHHWQLALGAASVAAIVTTIALSVFPGMALAFAGPNQNTWTTFLNRDNNLLTSWENIGNSDAIVNTVYGGDAGAWRWLNEHLDPGSKVATLDNRIYHLQDLLSFYYLDGPEAALLRQIDDPARIIDFLRARNVEYVFLPPWIAIPPTEHPLHRQLPLTSWLGSEWFPPVAIFHGPVDPAASVIYAVGPQPTRPLVSQWISSDTSHQVFRAGQTGQITIYAPENGFYRLTVRYRDIGYGPVDVRWQQPAVGAPLGRLGGDGPADARVPPVYGPLNPATAAAYLWSPWSRSILLHNTGAERSSELIAFVDQGFEKLEIGPFVSDLVVADLSLGWLGSSIDDLSGEQRARYFHQEITGEP